VAKLTPSSSSSSSSLNSKCPTHKASNTSTTKQPLSSSKEALCLANQKFKAPQHSTSKVRQQLQLRTSKVRQQRQPRNIQRVRALTNILNMCNIRSQWPISKLLLRRNIINSSNNSISIHSSSKELQLQHTMELNSSLSNSHSTKLQRRFQDPQ